MPAQPSSPPGPSQPVPAGIAHLELKAFLILLLVVALAGGFGLYVMYARGVFEETQRLVLLADDSEGVVVGADLTFSGFPIGRVSRIELAPDGRARLVIDVARQDAHWLRTSSVFTMERGMVGEVRIRAFSGVLADPPLPPDAQRPVLRGDASAEIPRLVATTRNLLDNLERMTGPNSSLNTALSNLGTASQRLSGPYGWLGAVLGSDEQAAKVIKVLDGTHALLVRASALLDESRGLIARADQRVLGVDGVVDEAQGVLAQTGLVLQEARSSLGAVDAVLAEAQTVAVNARLASTDLDVLRADVEASLQKLGYLVDEIHRKWPLARDTGIRLP
jgi:phospholipid/cholesterol/gamma-HCH transport system substrate-binding protein